MPFVPSTSSGYFPPYQNGYATGAGAAQLTGHPLAYNLFSPGGDDRTFGLNSMEALLRYNDTTSYSITGDLLTLCPNTFSQQRPRNMVTLRGFDVDAPGIAPALSSRTGVYTLTAGGTLPARPQASAVSFPTLAQIPSLTNSDFTASDGRMSYSLTSASSTLSKKLDLNRPLPEYPTPANGVMQMNAAFYAAQQARQDLAKDIFDRLRLITGADDPANFNSPTPPPQAAKDALRWLAQLAVNIVDFIDDDDIMTPFNWNPASPTDTVYGVEQPRVLINEVLVQYKIPTSAPKCQ